MILICALMMTLVTMVSYADSDTMFYVCDTSGSDENDGKSVNTPFKTIKKAQEAVRTWKGSGGEGSVTVYIKGGTYKLSETLSFGLEDSGSEGREITYKAYDSEKVTLFGGVDVDASYITDVTADTGENQINAEVLPFVKQIDLKALGITDYGTLITRGTGGFSNAATSNNRACEVELFADGEAMTLAKWPNEDYKYTGYSEKHSANSETGTAAYVEVQCVEGKCADWVDEDGKFVPTDARMVVFSDADYRTNSVRLWGVDADTGYMLCDPTNENDTSISKLSRYYVYNILSELDTAGEYYIDRQNGILYFYPKNDDAQLVLSVFDKAMVKFDGARYINFENIDFEVSRYTAVDIDNSSDITFNGCNIKNVGVTGIDVASTCSNILIEGCVITNTGGNGVVLNGGDINTLVPGNNTVKDCDIYQTTRFTDTASACVSIRGVGNKIVSSKLHDMPHQGINLSGNDHLISGNEFYNLCTKTYDCGAIYIGKYLAYRGTEISKNYFHDIKGYFGKGVNGVYLDDFTSETTIADNVFVDCITPIVVSGGCDNVVTGNFIYDCVGTLSIADNWREDSDSYVETELKSRLNGLDMELYRSHYPGLDEFWDDPNPALPKRNIVRDNIVYNGRNMTISDNVKEYGTVENNMFKRISAYVIK